MNCPDVPKINLQILSQTVIPDDGFTRICRSLVKFKYEDDSISDPVTVNHIVRKNIDAVTIIPHYWNDLDNQRMIYLRSAVRPAVQLHDYLASSNKENSIVDSGNQWELAAGLIEADEVGPQGFARAASRECEEELGFIVPYVKMKQLGGPIMVAAGLMPERIFFFETVVDPNKQQIPTEDGSPFERFGRVVKISLRDALKWIEEEKIMDAKTEIGLLRLAKKHGL